MQERKKKKTGALVIGKSSANDQRKIENKVTIEIKTWSDDSDRGKEEGK